METNTFNPLSIIAIVLSGLVAVLFLLQQYTLWTKDPKEPPFIAPRVPLIGHLISQFTEGPDFFRRLRCVALVFPMLNIGAA
jgi:hypothetical protein